jgi:hypothetical protein
MRRRAFLRGLGVAAGAGALGSAGVAGHPTPTDDGTPTEGTEAPTDGAGYGPLGHLDLAGTTETVVSPDGRTAYVAARTGYATVDLSNPAEPTLLAERRGLLADREGGPLRGIQDVKLDGDRLLVVGPANPMRDALAAAVLVDVSDPTAPERVAVRETDYPIHNCFLRDGVAYLTANGADGNPLVVLDAEAGLERVGSWSLFDHDDAWRDVAGSLRSTHDVWVQDGLAVIAGWDAGVWLLDVSEPSDPTYVADFGGRPPATLAALDGAAASRESTAPPGNTHYTQLSEDGSLLGVGRETWGVNRDDGVAGGPSGVDLYDLSDPAAPERLATVDPPPTPEPTFGGIWTTSHNFDIAGDTLYTSWYQGGVKRHDISDPAAPVQETWWRAPSRTRFWTAQAGVPGEFFVAADMGVNGGSPGVFTFPDEPGLGAADPDPPLTADGTVPATVRTSTPTATDTSTATTTERDAPGFGVAGALTSLGTLGLAAWRALARDRS